MVSDIPDKESNPNTETKEDLINNLKDLEGEMTALAIELEQTERENREKDIQVRIEDLTPEQVQEMKAKRELLNAELSLARSKARLQSLETERLKSLQAEKDWAKSNRIEIIASLHTIELNDILDKISSEGLGGLTEIQRLKWLGAKCPHGVHPTIEGREDRPRSVHRKYRIATQHRGKKRLPSFRGCLPLARRELNNGVMYPKSGMTRIQMELALNEGTIPLISKAGTLTAEDFEKGKSELPVLLRSATREQIIDRLFEIGKEDQIRKIKNIEVALEGVQVGISAIREDLEKLK